MELNEKLQELRKQSGLTQEELAERLFVSRTAISKWESGRGYPSIDSLKAIAEFFHITVDELLSSKELLSIAQKDSARKMQRVGDLTFGLLDVSFGMLIFIPIFVQREGDVILQVSLLSRSFSLPFIEVTYWSLILATVLFGVSRLALQNWENTVWNRYKNMISLALGAASVLTFIGTMEAYVAAFAFVLLIIKGVLLLKRE